MVPELVELVDGRSSTACADRDQVALICGCT